MATILKSENREFKENPGRIDNFRLLSDVSRVKRGLDPQNLNFDLRLLNPGQFSSPYHFHRNAEELFMIVSGTVTVRTPNGLEILSTGDLAFFEMGETGAHQLYNHGTESCTYLDIRTFTGTDICEYPDSGKTLLIPSMQVFEKDSRVSYFKGEENILEKWNSIKEPNS
ncbi:MAG: cupin domain-containing protein [Mariniphaga sp.]